jgi:hypothetical protein
MVSGARVVKSLSETSITIFAVTCVRGFNSLWWCLASPGDIQDHDYLGAIIY